MKSMMSTIMIGIALFGAGCNTVEVQDVPEQSKLELHLQEQFTNNRVRIELDNVVVFDSLARTNIRIGLATVIRRQIGNGNHSLRIAVDGVLRHDTTLSIADTTYIGIQYNIKQDTSIQLVVQPKPFGYV